MWFKLAGADFSKNNLGTMSSISSSYLINYSKLTGMSGTPTSVSYAGSSAGTAKSVEVTITVTSGYSFKSGSTITASGGTTGTVFTADKDYAGGSAFKFSMSVTGNVELTGAAEAVSTGGGSSSGGGSSGGDSNDNSGSGSTTYNWDITFTPSTTISDSTGAVASGVRGVSEIIPTDSSMSIVISSCKYIIYAYSDAAASTPLGFVSNAMDSIHTALASANRWHDAGTTRTLTQLLTINSNIKAIRLMTYDNTGTPTYNVTSSLADPGNSGSSSGGSTGGDSSGLADPTNFVIGTISGQTGTESSNTQRCRTDYLNVADLTSIKVTGADFIVACYKSDNTYVGKYLDGVINTTVEWNTAGTTITMASITAVNSNVAKIRIVGSSHDAVLIKT